MDNNDHLGEKLRLKELVDEDRYFGEHDRERLAIVKAQQATEQEEVLREQSRGRCPQCGEHLHARPTQSETILECSSCQGVWAHVDTLPAVEKRSEWLATFLRGLGWWRTFADTQSERNRHA